MHGQGSLSSDQVSEAVSSAVQESIHPLKQDIEEKFNLLTREVATASSACSNRVSQVIRNNSEVGTTITKISACQMEQSVKLDVMDTALVKIKQDLKSIQTNSEHTASNRAENTKKVSTNDWNQAKLDTALNWMKQNVEEIRTKHEDSASNTAEVTRNMTSIESNQGKIIEILSSISKNLATSQERIEKIETSVVHDGATKNLTTPTQYIGAANKWDNIDYQFHDGAAGSPSSQIRPISGPTNTATNPDINISKFGRCEFHDKPADNYGHQSKPPYSFAITATNPDVNTPKVTHPTPVPKF